MRSVRSEFPMTCPFRRRLEDSWQRLLEAESTEEAFERATEVWNDLHALDAQRRSVAKGLPRACGEVGEARVVVRMLRGAG